MVLVTLVGDSQARIGNRFYFVGPSTECKECKLRNVCFNLEPGSLYEVTGLRDTRHECVVHESEVRVVEVEKKPFRAAVPKKLAIDGSMITFESRRCDNMGCENRRLCCPWNVRDGDKLSVTDVMEDLDCPNGESLTMVRLI